MLFVSIAVSIEINRRHYFWSNPRIYGCWCMPDTRTQDNIAIPALGTYLKRNQTLQKNKSQKEQRLQEETETDKPHIKIPISVLKDGLLVAV